MKSFSNQGCIPALHSRPVAEQFFKLLILAGTAFFSIVSLAVSVIAKKASMVVPPSDRLMANDNGWVSGLLNCGSLPKSAPGLHPVTLQERNLAFNSAMAEANDHWKGYVRQSHHAKFKVQRASINCALKRLVFEADASTHRPQNRMNILANSNETLGRYS